MDVFLGLELAVHIVQNFSGSAHSSDQKAGS